MLKNLILFFFLMTIIHTVILFRLFGFSILIKERRKTDTKLIFLIILYIIILTSNITIFLVFDEVIYQEVPFYLLILNYLPFWVYCWVYVNFKKMIKQQSEITSIRYNLIPWFLVFIYTKIVYQLQLKIYLTDHKKLI